MNAANFDEALEQILKKDPRYHRDAYLFVRESLDYTQKMVTKVNKAEVRQAEPTEGRVRHVTGQELLMGIKGFAIETFGPMAITVLGEWGVHRCEDFGELVFNMVENNLLAKTPTDTREDFKNGYDFEDAFRKPFVPSSAVAKPPQPDSAKRN
jgi:uncharacterized repeat protein (TIGR04138 family)